MSEQLTDAIEHLTDEVIILRQVMDEIRVCFEWAVHNDRLRGCEMEEEPDLRAIVFDLRAKLQMLTLVVDQISQVPMKQKTLFPLDLTPRATTEEDAHH